MDINADIKWSRRSNLDEDKHDQSDKCVSASQFPCSHSSKDEQKVLNLFYAIIIILDLHIQLCFGDNVLKMKCLLTNVIPYVQFYFCSIYFVLPNFTKESSSCYKFAQTQKYSEHAVTINLYFFSFKIQSRVLTWVKKGKNKIRAKNFPVYSLCFVI